MYFSRYFLHGSQKIEDDTDDDGDDIKAKNEFNIKLKGIKEKKN